MTPTEFLDAPAGNYCSGEQFLLWARTPTSSGTVAWGRFSARSAQTLVDVWPYEFKLTWPYAAVIDLSAVEAVEPDAFGIILDYMNKMKTAAPPSRLVRQALIRPAGMVGALVAGFYRTLLPGFAWRDFETKDEAYQWALPDDPECSGVVDRLVAGVRASEGLLPRVAAALVERLAAPPTLQALADELGVSSRSLQRALQNANTNLRNELTRLRIEVAARRLHDTDDKIEAIAISVGFASLSAFAAAFRKRMGTTPSDYRGGRSSEN